MPEKENSWDLQITNYDMLCYDNFKENGKQQRKKESAFDNCFSKLY